MRFWKQGGRLALVLLLVGMGGAGSARAEGQAAFSLKSSAFADQGAIPSAYTCEGADRSPALFWSDVPAGTQSLALILDDPDAPDPAAPRVTWVHWVLANLPPDGAGLPEGMRLPPPGALPGINGWDRTGYRGPCPPVGRHRYFFKLYALDAWLDLLPMPSKSELERAMQGHVLAKAELVGTYQKTGK